MKKNYFLPCVRIVSVLPETLIALSTPNAYEDEDPDERAPQSSRGFDWDSNNDFWKD